MKIKDVRSMKLTMQLKSRSYDIILKAGCLANLHQFTNVANRKVFVLTDSGVPAEYAQTVAAQCPDSTVYTIPRGEGSKCLKVYGQVLQAMLAFGMDRKDLLVSVAADFVICDTDIFRQSVTADVQPCGYADCRVVSGRRRTGGSWGDQYT